MLMLLLMILLEGIVVSGDWNCCYCYESEDYDEELIVEIGLIKVF